MIIKTSNFGEIQIEKEKIITFEEGIPAFEDEREFFVIINEENSFQYLQSLNNPDLFFIVINPFEIFEDYDIELPAIAINKLKIEKEDAISVYTMVVVPEDIKKMTTNLSGPIVVNHRNMLGKQVILDDERYTTKHLILREDSQIGGN